MYYLVNEMDWVTVFTHLANYSGMAWALAQVFAAAMIFATPVAWAMIENDYGWGSVPQLEEESDAKAYEEADTIQDEDEDVIVYGIWEATGLWLPIEEAVAVWGSLWALPKEMRGDYIDALRVMYTA